MQRENSKTMSLHEFTESVQAPEPSFVQATEEPPDEEEMIPTINTGPLLVRWYVDSECDLCGILYSNNSDQVLIGTYN